MIGRKALRLACTVFAVAAAPLPLLAKPAIDCLERANYAHAVQMMEKSSEVLQFAERKREICVDLALRETGRGFLISAHCIGNTEEITEASYWIARGKPPRNYPAWQAAVQSCVESLSSEELVRRNNYLSSRFQSLKDQEDAPAKAAAEAAMRAEQEEMKKVAAAAAEGALLRAKSTVRQFTIKEMGLQTRRPDLDRISGGRKGTWTCKTIPELLDTEVCVASFESRACYAVEVPLGIGGLARTMQQCDTAMADMDRLPPETRKIASLGGVRVESVQVYFYKGQTLEVAFFLSAIDKTIRDGFVERWGPPDEVRGEPINVARWFAKDELLYQDSATVGVRSTALWDHRRQRAEELRRAAESAQMQTERAKRERDKKDF